MLRRWLSFLGIYKLYEKWLKYQIKNHPKPEHVGIILDGNRRWASKRSIEPWFGHYFGAKKTESVLKWCLELGIKSITLYAFSTENFKRKPEEVNKLFKIIEEKLRQTLTNEDIFKYKVRVKVIGRVHTLPKSLQEVIREVEEATKDHNERTLNLALAYGGRAEIVDAAKNIAADIKEGKLDPQDIEEDIFEKYLYTAHMKNQDLDLIIRTSGEERLSGFLLWQCAYSELCFMDVYWPDFRKIDLLRAVRTYQQRKRRFGV